VWAGKLCGTSISIIVGEVGKVYTVDVHPLAIKSIKDRVRKQALDNVVPILSTGYPVDIDSHAADVIYALDMFHHIKDPRGFLKELHRILKPRGMLFIESGHQPLYDAKQKILKSDCWIIVKEERNMFKCMPKGHIFTSMTKQIKIAGAKSRAADFDGN
jgi:ubiquinone/menaquinone biosynthesis C-methylase UbiE